MQNRLNDDFQREAEKVRVLQRKLAQYQEGMAHTALEKYTITFIQAFWRGCIARHLRRRMNASRLLCTRLGFWIQWRKQVAAAKVIVKMCMRYLYIKHMREVVYQSMHVQRIQKMCIRRYLQRRGIIRFRSHQVWHHVELFAMAKAKLRLSSFHREKRIIFNVFERFHRKMRARRYV